MDWDNLRIFLAVARSGQFLRAGRQLRLDHATVARRVNALETALNARLFERGPAGCALTAAGARLMETAERVESEILQAQGALADSALAFAGTVRIGAPDGVGTWYLLPRLARLLDAHPGLHIQLVPLPRAFSLAKREADLAITVDPPEDGRQHLVKLTNYTLGLYAAESYLHHQAPIAALADLAAHRVVTYVPDLIFTPSLDYLGDLGLPAGPRFECASVIGQMEAVRAGIGVGILHNYAVGPGDGLVRLLPERTLMRTYWLTAHSDVRDLARVRLVHDFILDVARADRTLFAPPDRLAGTAPATRTAARRT